VLIHDGSETYIIAGLSRIVIKDNAIVSISITVFQAGLRPTFCPPPSSVYSLGYMSFPAISYSLIYSYNTVYLFCTDLRINALVTENIGCS